MALRHVPFRESPVGSRGSVELNYRLKNSGVALVCRAYPAGIPPASEALAGAGKVGGGLLKDEYRMGDVDVPSSRASLNHSRHINKLPCGKALSCQTARVRGA
jgi:hypothetical protein